MVFSILTLFPGMFTSPFEHSILKRALTKNLIRLNLVNIRDFATDKYKTVDDKPYGGGVGMILKVDVIDRVLQKTLDQVQTRSRRIILLDPKGKTFNQRSALRLSQKYDHLIFICGHYEGVDARIVKLADEVVSIGDYILTGGELAAMVIVDSIARLVPGVLSKAEAVQEESFSQNLLEYPQYTRPQNYRGDKVPKILLSGNHQKISAWKRRHSQKIKKDFT